ncbi:MAG: DNA translocase FtsK, partial [Clostridia bacterium]|nr:DNA translocase FtsK [Clostridia bacterium]
MATKKKRKITASERKQQDLRREKQKNNLIPIVLILVAVFIAFSCYFGIPQLKWLADLGKGLLGVGIYLLPIALIYIAISVIVPEKKVPTPRKVASSIAILLAVGMTMYLFCAEEYTESVDFQLLWQGSVELKCGGVVPGVIAVPMIMFISRWGLGSILVAVALFCGLTITDLTMYDLWLAIKKLFVSMRGEPREREEKAEAPVEQLPREHPAVAPVQPVYPVENSVDVPIETYEVASDGLDENGQPVAETGLSVFGTEVPVDEEFVQAPTEVVAEEPAQPTAAEEDSEPLEIPEPPTGEQESMYVFPPLTLLQQPKYTGGTNKSEVEYNSNKLIETLRDFGVEARMLGVSVGPNVTRYELQPKAGTKVSKITGLSDDIALSLAATQVRIEAPIPGKAAVGIEIPNESSGTVYIRDLLDSEDFNNAKSSLTVALGKDISGKNIYADLSKMPHLLIAGSTGSGKSVCINTILMSLLYKASPKDVKLILIDPKVVELSVYNKIPHLFIPVVTDPKKAAGALHWACSEMDRRYNLFAELNIRDLTSYNEIAAASNEIDELSGEKKYAVLPRMVVIIDELADLMMVASKEVEEHICRLCQKARAAGIFLIIATQRPSVDVVTGLIKANVPSRIAFAVSSGVDSRVIMDATGAEKLLGRGDMLYRPIGANKPRRIQG